MSLTWKIGSTGDISINSLGKLNVVTSAQEVAQRVVITLNHYWYEYWLNLQGGVPWYELILGSRDVDTAKAIIRKIILQVPGVTAILNFSFVIVKRVVSIDVTIDTVYGEARVTTTLTP
jgi:hypothetical protein